MAMSENKDVFTETLSGESLFIKLVYSFKNLLFGVIFFLGAVILLFWNEGRAVRTYQGLDEGETAVRSASADQVTSENEGRLIHVSGSPTMAHAIQDPVFKVSSRGLRLSRITQIYQWTEEFETKKSKTPEGKEETKNTYTYIKKWVDKPVNSQAFKQPEGHYNPPSVIKTPSQDYLSPQAQIGAYPLPPSLIQLLPAESQKFLDNSSLLLLNPAEKEKAKIHTGGLYFGNNASAPEIGDNLIQFFENEPGPLSLVAQQLGGSLAPYITQTGTTIYIIKSGTHSAKSLFHQEQESNTKTTWELRGLGVFFMCFAFFLLASPLMVVADYVPVVGRLMSAGTITVTLLLGLVSSLGIIGLGWITARPLLGVALFILAGGLVFFFMEQRKEAEYKEARQKLSA